MANTNRFYDFIELKYNDLTDQINNWLKAVYNKSALNLNSASPYGQIVNVLKELFQHNIIYLKNTVKVLDIDQTQNKKVAQQTARIAGHNVSRAISATGTLKFTLKSGLDISKDIKDSVVIFEDGLLLKNKSNSLKYMVNLNVPKNIYPLSISNNSFYIPIIQGVYEKQRFTGTGRENQSFSVNIPGNKQVENFNYYVRYNGINLTIKTHLYDLLAAEYSCYVKSGFNGGIDVYFGTHNFGFIPSNGSVIEVEYILSDGASGEILNPVANDWKVDGILTDGQGNQLDADKLFNIYVENDINFASDGESLEFTKAAIPHVSRNFVLGTPNQFIYHLNKLNMFSKVNAFNKLDDNVFSITETVIEDCVKKINQCINNNDSKDNILIALNNFNEKYSKYKNNMNDNEIYLFLIPEIKKYFNDTVNYFNISTDAFYLDDYEKNKITNYLRQIGTLSISTEMIIIQPIITKYIMNVYVRRFDYANEETITQEIIAKSSDYLLNNNRFDRIPKADFISLFKTIDGVDSASVYFVSKKNEDYHKKAADLGYIQPPTQSKFNSTSSITSPQVSQPILTQSTKIKNGIYVDNSAYDPKLVLGLDPVHGNIICEKDEYAIIRGGWRDRKGIWYNEDMLDNSLNGINIVFDGVSLK